MKSELEILDMPHGLTAPVLAAQVIKLGYVIFDTTRHHAKELRDDVEPLLRKAGFSVVLLASAP